MLSQYTLGATRMAATGTTPTYFHSSADVDTYYPQSSGPAARRTKPGGENVRRTAAINDNLSQKAAINRESVACMQGILFDSEAVEESN